jgi:ABC-type enterochelin transport system permease subunit
VPRFVLAGLHRNLTLAGLGFLTMHVVDSYASIGITDAVVPFAYACWGTALIHALGTGTDTRTSIFLFLAGLCCAVVVAAVAWRIDTRGTRLLPAPTRSAGTTGEGR